VSGPRTETADESSQTITVVEKMDITGKTAIQSLSGRFNSPFHELSIKSHGSSLYRDLSGKKLTLPILLDCGCSTNLL
jgi:hypothetical protein